MVERPVFIIYIDVFNTKRKCIILVELREWKREDLRQREHLSRA
jgi:hypothetical protein